ncbi:questin oxidase family protein [Amantichitinum ursilacus]|uniref:DUF4243 domain-containing protein n=1 Tax=Amantichitinum ursilacus TaxID=857265 RepID=A0A0N0GLZ9_9NEIS|nr:questin oxidase family protein [Amantichitinum ursilacus]KPC50445.1 hypothetical protein WG78_17595 [Amantichitinum ursilacus]
MTSTSTLFALLDANRGIASVGGFSNHLPMALSALYRLGADETRLLAFDQQHRAERAATIPAATSMPAHWVDCLAQTGQFLALSLYFEQRIAREGAAAVMSEVFTGVPFAPATAAFHALIRLAHGLDVGHCGEIAAGLASYVSSYLPIELSPAVAAQPGSVAEQLAYMAPALSHLELPERMIIRRLRGVVADANFVRVLTAPPAHNTLLQDLAHAAIALYASTRNFTALHLVTGVNALRTVLDHLPAPLGRALMPAIWTAFCVTWASIGAPPVPHLLPRAADALPDWPALFACAIASEDDHDIKLTLAAYNENQAYPSPWYQHAVAQLFELAPA